MRSCVAKPVSPVDRSRRGAANLADFRSFHKISARPPRQILAIGVACVRRARRTSYPVNAPEHSGLRGPTANSGRMRLHGGAMVRRHHLAIVVTVLSTALALAAPATAQITTGAVGG